MLSRREFLRSTAIAGLSCADPRFVFAGAQRQRVVVIGAGMAGLSVATELLARGHDVTILEARLRPGGRVFTMRDAFADGLYADAGAMQVYDSHTRVQRYVTRLGLELDPIRPAGSGSLMHLLGRRIELPGSWPFALNADEQSLDARGLYAKYVVPNLAAVYEADRRGTLLERFAKHDGVTFTAYLRAQGASEHAIRILNAGLPIGLGDGGDHHSALNLLREAAYRQLRTQAFTIRGGTDRLPKALAAPLQSRIHYGTPVERIEQEADRVRVVARAGSGSRTFVGDRVVCAMPFSVLRSVAFTPALPARIRTAIDELPNTSVVKVFIQTRTRFWLEQQQSGGASTDLAMGLLSERSINQPGSRGLLEAYAAGESARRLCALSEDERVRVVTADIEKLFPGTSALYEYGTSKCWDDDEWARGAYAWFKPGQMMRLLPGLGAPDNRIHFAGDHTSSTPGWMEGALQSAERVVNEIG